MSNPIDRIENAAKKRIIVVDMGKVSKKVCAGKRRIEMGKKITKLKVDFNNAHCELINRALIALSPALFSASEILTFSSPPL